MPLRPKQPSLAALLMLGWPLTLFANSLSIDDVSLAEGDSGQTPFVFTITLDSPQSIPISVDVHTEDGSATVADNDYVALPTITLSFAPGELAREVTVLVIGDTAVEPDEQFRVVLSNPTGGATLARPIGIGTILNDDSPPTPTPVPTASPTPISTPTVAPTPTPSPQPSPTSAPTPTPSPQVTPPPTPTPVPSPPATPVPSPEPTPAAEPAARQLKAEITPVIAASGQAQTLRISLVPEEALVDLRLEVRIDGAKLREAPPPPCRFDGTDSTALSCTHSASTTLNLTLPLLAEPQRDTHIAVVARAANRADSALHIVGQSGERFARAPVHTIAISADAVVHAPAKGRLYVVGADGLFAIDPLRASIESHVPLDAADEVRWLVLLRDDLLAFGGPDTPIGLIALAVDGDLMPVKATGLGPAADGLAADLDGDGHPNLAVVDAAGLRTYALASADTLDLIPSSGPGAQRLTTGDFDGDGLPDLALIDAEGLWLLHGAGVGFVPAHRIAADGATSAAWSADRAELLIGRRTVASLEPPADLRLRHLGGRQYAETGRVGAADTIDVIALPDNDGVLRLSVSGGHRLDRPSGDPADALMIVSPGARRGIAADIDGDGRTDIVLARGALGLDLYTDLTRTAAAPQTADAGGGAFGGSLLLLALYRLRRHRCTVCWAALLLVPGAASAAILHSPEPSSQTLTLTAEALPVSQSYRLEVDGIDVSALAQIDTTSGDWRIAYTPPQPLAGTVTVRLFRSTPDQALESVGEWSFESPVPDAPRWRAAFAAGVNGNTVLGAERDLKAQLKPRETTDGSLRPELGWQSGALQLHGDADVAWNSRLPGSRGDPDLGRFRLQADHRHLSLQAGPQALGPGAPNLIVDRAQRRGLALRMADGPWGSSAQGYVARFGALQGFRGGFGIGDPDRRIAGGHVGLTPWHAEDRHLQLRVGAVEVHAPLDGHEETRRLENRSHSLAMDARYRGWSAGAELARSQTAAEGVFTRYDGDAMRTQLRYDASPSSWQGWPLAWSGALQHQRISAFYESRAQFGLPADQQRTEAMADLFLGRLGLQASVSEARDNVDRRPVGQVAATLWSVDVTVLPGDGAPAWYGAPTWLASVREQQNRQRRAHPDPAVVAVDDRATDYELGLRLDHELWSVGFNQRRTQTADASFTRATDHSAIDLSLQPLPLGTAANWMPMVALLRTRDRSSGLSEFVFEAGVGIGIDPGGAWSASVDARFSRSLDDERFLDDRQWLLTPSLRWNLPFAGERRLAFVLSGSYQASRFGAETIEDWSALLSASLNLSWKHPHAP